MFMELIRIIVGSIRFFLTLVVLFLGGLVVYHDVWLEANVSSQAYLFLGTMLTTVVVYQICETSSASKPKVFKDIFLKIKDKIKK